MAYEFRHVRQNLTLTFANYSGGKVVWYRWPLRGRDFWQGDDVITEDPRPGNNVNQENNYLHSYTYIRFYVKWLLQISDLNEKLNHSAGFVRLSKTKLNQSRFIRCRTASYVQTTGRSNFNSPSAGLWMRLIILRILMCRWEKNITK